MRELRSYGSVRGEISDGLPYRDLFLGGFLWSLGLRCRAYDCCAFCAYAQCVKAGMPISDDGNFVTRKTFPFHELIAYHVRV
jgi:hypothetical protein